MGAATVLPAFLVGALALQLRGDLGASLAEVGAGVTVFFAAGAIGAGPLGRVTQRVGAIATMRAGVFASGACMLAIAAFATGLPSFFALLALGGLANGAAQPAINLFLAEEVQLERQGLAFGVKQSAIPAAITVSGLALPVLALPFGWRPTVALCGLVALGVGATTTRQAWSRARPPAPSPSAPAPPRATPVLLLLAVGAAFASFGPAALAAYLVATAVDAGIGEGAAGLVLALGSAASLLARVGLGERADRRADYGFRTVAVLLGCGSVGYALLATGSQGLLLAGTLVAFTLGWGWPGLFNLAVVHGHRSAPAAATGITQAGIYVGAAAGPAAFGLLAAEAGFSFAWVSIAVTALLAALAVAIAQTRFGNPVPGTNRSGAEAGIRHR